MIKVREVKIVKEVMACDVLTVAMFSYLVCTKTAKYEMEATIFLIKLMEFPKRASFLDICMDIGRQVYEASTNRPVNSWLSVNLQIQPRDSFCIS